MQKIILTLWLCANVFYSVAQQGDAAADDLYDLSLEELLNVEITTATKTSGKADVAPAIIDVITFDQIKQRGYQNLGHLLNDIADNHEDRANWGIGEPTHQNVGFGFRFDSGQNILLLFNGQRLNAFLPGNRFGGEEYLLESIDRIEIIRGPGSALYGTGAFTAVVNIITKTIDDPAQSILTAGVQYSPTAKGWVSSAGMLTTLPHGGSINAAFRAGSEQGQSLEVDNALFGNQTIRDGINYTYDGEATLNWKHFSVQGKLTRQSRNTYTGFNAVNPSTMDELELYMHAYSLGTNYSRSFGKSTIKMSGGWHEDNWTEVGLIPIFATTSDPDALPTLDFVSLYRNGENITTSFFIDGQGADTRSYDAELQWTYNYKKANNIVLGAYIANDKVLDAVRPTELNLSPLEFIPFREIHDPVNNWLFDLNASRRTFALYGQADHQISDQWYVNAGARWDNFSGTGVLTNQKYAEFNPRVALVFNDESIGTIKALAGTATRIPNGFETLSSVAILGDPNNTPERIETLQSQWIRNWNMNIRTEAGIFRSRIKNRLETNADLRDELRSQGFIGQFVNVGSGVVQSNNGLNLKVVAKVSRSIGQVTMTQYFGSNNGFDQPIFYMPHTMINCDYTYSASWYSINFGFNYRADIKKPANDPRGIVKDYLVARTNLVVNPRAIPFSFQITCRNLFDTNYKYPSSSFDFTNHFPARGIDVSLGATYTIKGGK